MSHLCKAISFIAISTVLGGCGSSVTISDPTIPEPLIAKLPMSVAGRYPERFQNFVHEERVIGKEKWTINLGRSNAMLFDQLFASMFTDYVVIDDATDPKDLGIDALIEPTIDAFEFSVPNQSQTEEFAVWIRYRIKVFDNQGKQVANWPISAYGKAQATTFGSDAALRRAAVLAMRDAAALIIMQMDKSTGVSKLAQSALNPATPDTAPFDEPETSMLQTTAAEETVDETG
jgi:hypothetical protein